MKESQSGTGQELSMEQGATHWKATVLTLFPEMFPGPLGLSLAGQALKDGVWALETVDIRAFASDKHRSVDDAPFGGGAGMVMRPDVVDAAIAAQTVSQAAKTRDNGGKTQAVRPLVYLTPRGRPLTQQRVRQWAAGPGIVMLCGRFEGVDQRVLEAHDVEEVSVGDYILSGGDVAALVVLDACVRLLPGVVGKEASLAEESFETGLLEYPHYTRPQVWQGQAVPDVLLSGHHEKIKDWRLRQSEEITRTRRADLWRAYVGDKDVDKDEDA